MNITEKHRISGMQAQVFSSTEVSKTFSMYVTDVSTEHSRVFKLPSQNPHADTEIYSGWEIVCISSLHLP